MHFLFIGLVLFGLYEFLTNESKTIVVDENTLTVWMQYRNKAFSPVDAKENISRLNGEQLQRYIEEFLSEEALYRQALKLGLDQNDAVIRQRIVQKMEFILLGLAGTERTIRKSDALSHFREHASRYLVPAHVTLKHEYFSGENAFERAQLFLSMAPSIEGGNYSDRFIYRRNYVEAIYPLIRDHLGQKIANTVFSKDAIVGEWFGPIESPFGWHVVKIITKAAERLPEFDEVAAEVAGDLQRKRRDELKRLASEKVLDQFVIENRLKSE